MVKGVSDRRVYRAEQVIFREGQEGHTAFLVNSGRIAIIKGAAERGKLIAHAGPNEIFGEMALIDGSPRMANAVAAEHSSCTIIDKEHFSRKLSRLDKKKRNMFDFLIRYIRDTMPLDIRKETGDLEESHNDIMARVIVDGDDISEELGETDRFLKALFEILVGYAKRRLPPEV